MKKPLHILHVEDSPADAELVRALLAADGLDCTIEVAGNRREFEAALARGGHDVILTDYALPDYNGEAALRHAKQHCPAVPLIVLSGTMGEDAAVHCLRAGAVDYLIKDRPARLPAAIRQAVEMAEEHRRRQLAEAALRESEAMFRSLAETAPLGIGIHHGGPYCYVNPLFQRLTGYPRAELLRLNFWEFIHPDHRELVRARGEARLRGEHPPAHYEVKVQSKDGCEVWVEIRETRLEYEGRPAGLLTLADVTARKLAEGALRSRDAILEATAFAAAEFLNNPDVAGSLPAVLKRLGRAAEVCRAYVFENHPGPDGALLTSQRGEWTATGAAPQRDNPLLQNFPYVAGGFGRWMEVLQRGEVMQARARDFSAAEREVLEPQGIASLIIAPIMVEADWWGFIGFDECRQERVWSPVEVSAVVTAANTLGAALTRQRAQAKQQEAEAALRESEERFRLLAEQSADGFWFVTPAPDRMVYVSPAMERLWGLTARRFYDDAGAWLAAIHPEDQPRVRRAFAAWLAGRGERYQEQYRVVRPDGTVRWVLDSGTAVCDAGGRIIRLGGIARDITEEHERQRLLQRSQRLESIGTLAGGVAHDLNNALAPIMMSVEMLRLQYPDESSTLEIIQNSARRAADMVRQLLTFAKGAEGARVTIQPAHLLKEMQGIIKGTFPKNIELEVCFNRELPLVVGDATQLHQVLLNLCVNARDAMPQGGKLSLEAQRCTVSSTEAAGVPGAQAGEYVVVRVRDNGTGIPPDVLDRIFDPFFTTKGPEKGTGLGLSTVMGIVKGHGGFVQVASRPGQGSTFSVYLPANREGSHTEHFAQGDTAFLGRGEAILLVDDEPPVREMGRTILQGLNCKPLLAADGAEALVQVANHRDELRAVLLDLHMPRMDGLALARALRRTSPNLPIAVLSGRMEDPQRTEFLRLGVKSQLAKPFTAGQLASLLQELLPSA